jgi:hypothetical protein
MVAIMIAALLGAGFSTLVLAPFGIWAVLLGIPLMGSLAALACAAVIFIMVDREERHVNVQAETLEDPLPSDL